MYLVNIQDGLPFTEPSAVNIIGSIQFFLKQISVAEVNIKCTVQSLQLDPDSNKNSTKKKGGFPISQSFYLSMSMFHPTLEPFSSLRNPIQGRLPYGQLCRQVDGRMVESIRRSTFHSGLKCCRWLMKGLRNWCIGFQSLSAFRNDFSH